MDKGKTIYPFDVDYNLFLIVSQMGRYRTLNVYREELYACHELPMSIEIQQSVAIENGAYCSLLKETRA